MVRKQLTEEQVVEILQLKAAKVRLKDIAARFNVNISTICRRLAVYRREKRYKRKKTVRPKKVGLGQRLGILNLALNEPFTTYAELRERLNLTISNATLARYCREFGYRKRVSPKKFFINQDKCYERLVMARNRCNWPIEEWKKIVFTDESGLDNSGFHRKLVFRRPAQRFHRNFVYQAPNKSLRINFFSWVTRDGTGQIIPYQTMNADLYCEVIRHMIETLRQNFGHDDFKIVHDNAKFATCVQTVVFLRRNNYARYFLPITAYSPDMNIIENAWAMLKHKVRKHCFKYGQTSRRVEFLNLIQREWASIGQEIVDNLYQSLPIRMRAIVEARGLLTRF